MAEGARLLSVCRFTPTEGSNPSLSATSTRRRASVPSLYLASKGYRRLNEPLHFGSSVTLVTNEDKSFGTFN